MIKPKKGSLSSSNAKSHVLKAHENVFKQIIEGVDIESTHADARSRFEDWYREKARTFMRRKQPTQKQTTLSFARDAAKHKRELALTMWAVSTDTPFYTAQWPAMG